MGIDLVLSGLMVLCFDGLHTCAEPMWNVAWIVKANGDSNTCGRRSREETESSLLIKKENFTLAAGPRGICSDQGDHWKCVPSAPPSKMCIATDDISPEDLNQFDSSVCTMAFSLSDLDSRFIDWDRDKLTKDASARILFEPGFVRTRNPIPESTPGYHWLRSSGSIDFKRQLANSLVTSYPTATMLTISDCEGKVHLKLRRDGAGTGTATVFNKAKADLRTDVVPPGNLENLSYLLWYYQLGKWKDTYSCPRVDGDLPPVLLQCKKIDPSCAFDFRSGSTMWPPVMKELPSDQTIPCTPPLP